MPRLLVGIAVLFGSFPGPVLCADDTIAADSPFVTTTVDIGMVVSDVATSRKFYEDVVGFAKSAEFTVPAEMGAHSGLSDNQPFHITVLTLGGAGETATKLKLMQFPKSPGARQDQSFIHSTLGVSYLTVHVKDLEAVVERAAKHGAKPIGKGVTPVPFAPGVTIALFRDPDGNFVEFVGVPQK